MQKPRSELAGDTRWSLRKVPHDVPKPNSRVWIPTSALTTSKSVIPKLQAVQESGFVRYLECALLNCQPRNACAQLKQDLFMEVCAVGKPQAMPAVT